jgi:ppGpp synthetase/RelA/SpoT-type nucleotidyltranferase
VRSKSVSSFITKATKLVDGKAKYTDPLNEIQDQLGARIITFYLSDLQPICTLVEKYFGPIEKRHVEPESENEFGYEGFHFILFIPEDCFIPDIPRDECPKVFELQVRTLFQHAWAQANHDLAYKPLSEPSKEFRRKVAFTAAQAWGADTIFDELLRDHLSET